MIQNTGIRESVNRLELNHFVVTQQSHTDLASLRMWSEILRAGNETYLIRFELISLVNANSPLGHGVSQMVIKSITGCSISSTVVDLPCITVMHGDLPSRSIDSPPEKIVKVSLHRTAAPREMHKINVYRQILIAFKYLLTPFLLSLNLLYELVYTFLTFHPYLS